MSPEHSRKIHPVTPREALANAMMGVQGEYILEALSGFNKEIVSPHALTAFVNKASRLGCHYATKRVFRYLELRNQDSLFKSVTIITGVRTKDFRDHSMFLAEGEDGVWYAGSPANNTGKRHRFSKLFESESLGEVLSGIKKEEGGRWPSEDAITQKIAEEKEKGDRSMFMGY